ncbi:MAG: hypothetical protein ACYTHM_14900 [Planctomycetota bacterium]|jgi:hypothetical protein
MPSRKDSFSALRLGRLTGLLSIFLWISQPLLQAEWRDCTVPVPLDRLLANLTAYIKENPKDAGGYYVLGRVHSMAFAFQQKTYRLNPARKTAEGKTGVPGFPPWSTILVKRKGKAWKFTPEVKAHLLNAIQNYRKSTALAPKKALTFLGLGWVLEQAISLSTHLDPLPEEKKSVEDIPDEARSRIQAAIGQLGAEAYEEREKASRQIEGEIALALPILLKAREHEDVEIRARIHGLIKFYWEEKALAAYRKAFSLALTPDLKLEYLGKGENSAVSLEAGESILRLLRGRPKTEATEAETAKVKEAVEKLRAKPRIMTPIIFPLDETTELEDLLALDRRVRFDLDGDGEPSLWPWVRPETAILVWDPLETGRIRSGLQLFGSATWWMFWENGYQALASLDDDRDGRLTGGELRGIRVWRDRNGNGVSDPGEVTSPESVGVEAIGTKGTRNANGVLENPRGIRLKCGRWVPTFDWLPESIPESGETSTPTGSSRSGTAPSGSGSRR